MYQSTLPGVLPSLKKLCSFRAERKASTLGGLVDMLSQLLDTVYLKLASDSTLVSFVVRVAQTGSSVKVRAKKRASAAAQKSDERGDPGGQREVDKHARNQQQKR